MERSAMESLLPGATILLAILPPLPFGSVDAVTSAILTAACLALGAVWAVRRARAGEGALPWREPLLAWGIAFAALGAVQIAPIPRPLLSALSPTSVEMRDAYEPAPRAGSAAAERPGASGARPPSMYPWATGHAALRILACTLVALIAAEAAASRRRAAALAAALAASGFFQAVYGLFEHLSGRARIFAYAKVDYADVATGTFINRNHYAAHLAMTLPMAVALAAGAWARPPGPPAPRAGGRPAAAWGRGTFVAGAFLVAALIMATALVASRSRMGMASALVAVLTVGIWKAGGGRGRGFLAAAALVGVAALLVVGRGGGASAAERFSLLGEDLRGGLGRPAIWEQASAVAGDFPILGAGMGTFGHVFPAFRTGGEGAYLAHAHNDYVELAAETGAAGCALLAAGVVLVAAPIVRAREARPELGLPGRAAAAGILAVALHSAADFALAVPANAVTFALLAGILLAWKRAPAAPEAVSARARGARAAARGWAPAALLALLAAAAAAPAAPDAAGAGGGAPAPSSRAAGRPAPAGAGLPPRADSGNADRWFRAAAAEGRAALADLHAIARAAAAGGVPSRAALAYVERRLGAAAALQEEGLRRLPSSALGHLGLAELRAGLCAARGLTGEPPLGCPGVAAAEFASALALAPMSAAVAARAADFYIRSWPALDETSRTRARSAVERARRLSRLDADSVRRWESIRSGEAAAPAAPQAPG
jgi:O-antigen ligase